jgi:hypothetical protein
MAPAAERGIADYPAYYYAWARRGNDYRESGPHYLRRVAWVASWWLWWQLRSGR